MDWQIIKLRDVAWETLEQKQLWCIEQVKQQQNTGFLLLSEPHPTFTFGRSASAQDRIWSPQQMKVNQASEQLVSRGGKWTYHGPGQLLLYPIVRISELGFSTRGVSKFLNTLRATVADCLLRLGVETETGNTPFGLYANGSKLVSFGVALRHGICSHGLALYLRDQSNYFAGIHPCGVTGGKITSLQTLGKSLTWETVAVQLTETVKKNLGIPQDAL